MQNLDAAVQDVDFGTVTIQNVTDKLLELQYNHKLYYLQPGAKWSLDKEIGRLLQRRNFRQLEIVGEDEPATVPPTQDPNRSRSYKEMHPSGSRPTTQGKLWCNECGKAGFKDITALKDHERSHTEETRREEAARAKEEAERIDAGAEPEPEESAEETPETGPVGPELVEGGTD